MYHAQPSPENIKEMFVRGFNKNKKEHDDY